MPSKHLLVLEAAGAFWQVTNLYVGRPKEWGDMIPDFLPEMMLPEEEKEPYQVLPEGVYETDLNDIHTYFVQRFGGSARRSELFSKFSLLQQDLVGTNVEVCQWVAGSFVTSKVEPGDIDLMSIGHRDVVNAMQPQAEMFVNQWLKAGESAKPKYGAHTFFEVYFPPDDPRYSYAHARLVKWREFWCKTRRLQQDVHKVDGTVVLAGERYPKGILCVRTESSIQVPPI